MPSRILIAGGGSGGHVFPAIAIGQALQRLQPDVELLFVGAKGKLEEEKVPAAGFELEVLPIRGLDRQNWKANLWFPFRLIRSLVKSAAIVARFKPQVVVGVGGYASWPLLQWAIWKSIPTVIQEQNFYPGLVNRIVASRVDKICVAYKHIEEFPKEKLVLTGNPVRKEFYDCSFPAEGETKRVLILGGSLGARTLNEAMKVNVSSIASSSDVQFVWQMGERYTAEYGKCETAKLNNVRAVPFLDNMAQELCRATLIVSRAGAIALSELALLGKAAIIVPSPNVAEDHQMKNARALERYDACRVVPDAVVNERLIHEIMALVHDQEEIKKLETNMRLQAKEKAEERIAKEIVELIK